MFCFVIAQISFYVYITYMFCFVIEQISFYVFQKKFDDCKDQRRLPFDFYLPEFNCCIEVDGQQHFEPSKFSNESDEYKDFIIRKKHDKIKTDYCLSHGIDLLRIDYNDIRRKNNNYKTILLNKFTKK